MCSYVDEDAQCVHFLSAPPERKWTESPAVRDPAFRILKARKEEAEIVMLDLKTHADAEIPVRNALYDLHKLQDGTGI